jgi:diaminopropionate ammonia-lyase
MGFEFQINAHRTAAADAHGAAGARGAADAGSASDPGGAAHVLGAADAAPAFHRRMAGYAPSELRDSPELAQAMRVGRVLLKVETERFGLPAFKILGASWAAERLLADRDVAGVTLVTATDGNHGRAVARVARMRGLPAHILVPTGTAQARIDGIAGEGAHVEVVDGSYDEAVEKAAGMADPDHVVLSDTSWPGYEDVPRWVVEGYATIFSEADEQLGGQVPDVAFIPIGVGSLAVAAARHWPDPPPRLVGLEPGTAACALESIRAGEPVTVPGPHTSIMAGLNAGTVSKLAWPVLRDRYDAFCAIDDRWAEQGMRDLAAIGVRAGEVSGGTVGAATAICGDAHTREALGIDENSTLFLLLTEGLTDPASWTRIVRG